MNGNISEQDLCELIYPANLADVHQHHRPVFVFNLHEQHLASKGFSRKFGVPTLRVSSETDCDSLRWKNLNLIEKELLVSILTPEASILHMLKDVADHYKYRSIVVIYDNTFSEFCVVQS